MNAPDKPTARQQQVLDAVRESVARRGYPPTLREIGASIGIRSTRGVSDHLLALERKGYVRLAGASHGAARGVVLTGKDRPGLPTPTHTVDPLPQAARDLAVTFGSAWFAGASVTG